jgi:single-strand DNA-binding protein
MPNGAEITLVGNLTKDPELRFTNTDKAIGHFSVAVTRYIQGDRPNVTSFFDVVAWEKLGEHVCESLTKGQRVIVCGRLESRQWEKDDGSKGQRWEVTADAVGPDLRFAPLSGSSPPLRRVPANTGYGGDESPF